MERLHFHKQAKEIASGPRVMPSSVDLSDDLVLAGNVLLTECDVSVCQIEVLSQHGFVHKGF